MYGCLEKNEMEILRMDSSMLSGGVYKSWTVEVECAVYQRWS